MAQPEEILQIRMLGDFQLLYNGKPLQLESNYTNKTMRVLQRLLYRGQNGILRDSLLSSIFDADTTANPLNNLKVTISNLRNILKRAGLPATYTLYSKNQRYYFSSPEPMWMDVWAFETLLTQAYAQTNEDEKLDRLMQAFSLYQGDFLPHLAGEDWVTATATQYRNDYFNCVQAIAGILKARSAWERLLPIAVQVVSLYPMETWQCLWIDCLMALEQYQQAKQVYDQAVITLAEDFAAKPSDELIQRFHLLDRADYKSHETVYKLSDKLRENDPQAGAYYCSYPSFIDVYRTSSRMIERSGQSAFLLMYWLVDTKGRPLENSDKLSAEAGRLRDCIQLSLRRGDTFTQYGCDRFLVLLIGTNRENCNIVDDRIVQRYKQVAGRGIHTHHSLQVVETGNPSFPAGIWV